MLYCNSAVVSVGDALKVVSALTQQLSGLWGHCENLRPALASRLGFRNWAELLKESKVLLKKDDLVVLLEATGKSRDPEVTVIVDNIFRANCRPSIYAPLNALLGCVMVDAYDLRFDPRLYSPNGSRLRNLFKLPGRTCSADAWDEMELQLIQCVREYQVDQYDEIQELVMEKAGKWLREPVDALDFIMGSASLQQATAQCRSERDVRRVLARHYEPQKHSATSLDELLKLMLVMVQINSAA